MNDQEIERKFLLVDFPAEKASDPRHIEQGYLATAISSAGSPPISVRLRRVEAGPSRRGWPRQRYPHAATSDSPLARLAEGGHLLVHNGLQPARDLTIRADAGTVMQLSNVRIGFAGMPNYLDSAGREVVAKMLRGKLRIEGIMGNLTTLNQVTRLFSVQGGGERRRP